jgi:hypothetical protein
MNLAGHGARLFFLQKAVDVPGLIRHIDQANSLWRKPQ